MSLLLSGIVTWFLVRNVEIANAEAQLVRSAAGALGFGRPVVATCVSEQGGPSCQQGLQFLAHVAGADRVLILNPRGTVLVDDRQSVTGEQVRLGARRSIAVNGFRLPVRSGEVSIGGQNYLGLAFGNRGYLVMVAKSESSLTAAAIANLLPPLVLAGSLALAFAVIVALLLSHGMTRRLRELARAAEDVGAGNYSRRVDVEGSDEIQVVGKAFNRMVQAVEGSRQLQREFLANASHELKTPLTSLIGFSQALIDGSLEEEPQRQRAASVIHEEAERVLRISQELLDLARVESGQVLYHLEPVDLGALFRDEADLHRPRAEERGLTIELQVPETVPPVLVDPDRLHQIVTNLIDNAVKYAPQDSVITVETKVAGEKVAVLVTNLIGPYRPDPARMFDRFYRADPARSSATAGVGLGLSICRQLAEAQGGQLSAEVDDGRVTLTLSLPRAAWDPEAGFEQAEVSKTAARKGVGVRLPL